ncbi:MAG: 5-(carboxyamino)imidazole ribonucleotide mutase [Acidobacteria bacterium]|nr:5-(carboxyamino)imidazole ribonucleotide mutase [Acidobacteriota bacterium]
MKNPLVSILMGSDSDLPTMLEAAKVLRDFNVPYDLEVASAHRSPARVRKLVKQAARRGVRLFIVGAGGAAHLAGVIAAETTLPVIGVPLDSSALKGLDSLLSTLQMPAGVPVATMAVGKAGATNAAVLAIQILSLADKGLAKKLEQYKADLEKQVVERSRKIKEGSDL